MIKVKLLGIAQGQFTDKESGREVTYRTLHLLNEESENALCGGVPYKESLPNKVYDELMAKYGDLHLLANKYVIVTYDLISKKVKALELAK